MDEGAARRTSAPRMRRAARTAGCAATYVLQPAGVDVPGGRGGDNGGGGAGGAAVPHSDAMVWVGSVWRPFLLNRDPHCGLGQLGS